MKKKIIYIIIILIISYGIFLRFYNLGFGSFWIDEGYSSLISYFSYINGFPPIMPNGTSNASYFLHTILQSISFYFFGISDFSARVPSFAFGIINLFLFILLGYQFFKNSSYKYFGILLLIFLYTFSTREIIWSREARFYEILNFFYIFSVLLLVLYINSKKNLYLLTFFIFSSIGSVFHPFCYALILIGIITYFVDFFKHNFKKDFQKNLKYLIGVFTIFIIYFSIKTYVNFLNYGNFDFFMFENFIYIFGSGNFFIFLKYYILSIYNELGIVFIIFLAFFPWLVFRKNSTFFILYFLFLVNIIFISLGYMAHARYVYHLFFIIILVGTIGFSEFLNLIKEKINFKLKYVVIGILSLSFIVGIFYTYKLTFLPQKFYYIDNTSPKPNFKMAYEFLKTKENPKIISGFSQICLWYNLDDTKKCEFALKVNLTGTTNSENRLNKQTNDIYTNIPYIVDLNEINITDYYFVLDSLTMKNIIDKKLLENIRNTCDLIYKDVGDYNENNFIGVWKCV